MVDFSKYMRQTAGQAKKPPTLEIGDYPAVVRSYELGESKQNKTPFVRVNLTLTGWPEGAEPQAGVDLGKRQQRKDYYLTDDALWRLDDFLRSCGIDLGTESAPRAYEETLAELSGKDVIATVEHYVNQQTGEIGNQVGKVAGVA